jgi:hypothetical protein
MASSVISKPTLIRDVTMPSATSITANNYTTVTADLSFAGYVPKAVIGFHTTNTSVFVLGDVSIRENGSAQVTVWNNYRDTRSGTITLTVLYEKA